MVIGAFSIQEIDVKATAPAVVRRVALALQAPLLVPELLLQRVETGGAFTEVDSPSENALQASPE